jgi:hypothetical protein
MKLLSLVKELTTYVTRIDGLTTIHMVLWKQILNVDSLSVCVMQYDR